MKKYLRYIVAFCLCLCFCTVATYASAPVATSSTEIVYLEDGNYVEIVTTVFSNSRSTITDASKEYIYKTYFDRKLFSYTLWGRFEYNGTTSKATDVAYTHTIYDSEWNLGSHRESYSSNTVYGSATFGGPYIETIGGSISCDKNGNIS